MNPLCESHQKGYELAGKVNCPVCEMAKRIELLQRIVEDHANAYGKALIREQRLKEEVEQLRKEGK